MNIELILKDLINIQSDKSVVSDNGNFEYGVAVYLREYIKENFPRFIIEEQKVESGRVNLFVHDGAPTELLFVGHMDTVEQGGGWTTDPKGELKDGKMFGRGSADMKAGLVAILSALDQAQSTERTGIGALFYCDEEYYFKGMKKFVEEYGDKLSPKLIVDPEPTQEKLRNATRGIFEVKVKIKGRSGHSARPDSGISAFMGLEHVVDNLRKYIDSFTGGDFGNPTINIANVVCGSLQEGSFEDTSVLGTMGNVIPDYCEAIIEVRTVPGCVSREILNQIQLGIEQSGCIFDSFNITIDLESFFTDKKYLKVVEEISMEVFGEVNYQEPQQGGYVDVQMLAKKFDCPVVIWGPKGDGMHAPDEYVEIESLNKLEKVFRLLVDKVGGEGIK